MSASPDEANVSRGLLLGLLAITIFAFSIPMTRLASGSVEDPQLHPLFVAFGRAALAGLCAIAYLWWVRARRITSADLGAFGLTAAGVVLGWPIFLGLAVREVEAVHASVVSGILPLVTAMIAARVLRQRPSNVFWLTAVAGCALVIAYALLRSGQISGAVHVVWADLLLLAAVVSASMGYVSGAGLSARMAPEQVICWVLVLSLPLTLPVSIYYWPSTEIRVSSWVGFLYVALFSMWLGFFAWYRALAIGGTVRVSQVQLLQPFLSLLFCVPVLGESIDLLTIAFSLLIVATVFLSKRQAVSR